jgi:hypothetical protein
MAIFFKFQKQKFSFQISKTKIVHFLWWYGQIFSNFFKKWIFSFQIFLGGINEFYLRLEVAKFIKNLQKLPIYLNKKWSTVKEPYYYEPHFDPSLYEEYY